MHKILSPRSLLTVLAATALCLLTACSGASGKVAGANGQPSGSSKVLQVVAGENFWGSIAQQLGGTHVNVTSVVSDPNADPHEYESSSADAREIADANYVILNGAGYDTWGDQLIAASPNSTRKVFKVADLLGKKEGDNPHFWYSPDYVEHVVQQITADYKSLDPADASDFDHLNGQFENALGPYRARIAEIKHQFAAVPVSSTESIFEYMASALGLNLISPPGFMQAVAEGNDPSAADVATFQQQLQSGQSQVLVYNLQTATAVTSNLKQIAASHDIPVVGVTETVQPPDASFQEWMNAELITIQNALNAKALAQ